MSNQRSRGFSLVELLIVVAVIGILTAIAVPAVLQARIAANEGKAIGYVRTWHSGQECYKKKYTNAANPLGKYAWRDEHMVKEGCIGAGVTIGGGDFTTGDQAYLYTIDSSSNPNNWFGHAHPRNDASGQRSFYTNQQGTIYYTYTQNSWCWDTGCGNNWKVLGK